MSDKRENHQKLQFYLVNWTLLSNINSDKIYFEFLIDFDAENLDFLDIVLTLECLQ